MSGTDLYGEHVGEDRGSQTGCIGIDQEKRAAYQTTVGHIAEPTDEWHLRFSRSLLFGPRP